MILVKAERYDAAATLLGWVSSKPNFRSPPPREIEKSIGQRAEESRRVGVMLSTEDAIHFAIETLRAAANDLDSGNRRETSPE